MSASKLSRMDQLFSRNGSFHNDRQNNYRSNSSFENQLNFVKDYFERQQQSTYMHSNAKTDSSNIFNINNQAAPLTNRLPPSSKKQSYYTPQKINRQILSSSILEKDTSQQRSNRNLNLRNPDSEFFGKNEFKEISSIKKKTPIKERRIDQCNYDDNDECTASQTPCQKILQSYEKENHVLKSELNDHNEEMRDINKKIRDMQRENKRLIQALQEYIDKEDEQEKFRVRKESDTIVILKEEIAKQHTFNTKLAEKMEELKIQYMDSEDQKEKYYKKCVALAKKLKSFQTSRVDMQEKILNIEPELDKQQIKNELLEQDARHLQMELDFWRQKAEDQEYEILKFKRNDDKIRAKLQEFEDVEAQDKEKQYSELQAYKQKFKQMEIENSETKEQLKRLKSELGNNNFSEESAQDTIASLKAKLVVETSRADSLYSRERDYKKKIEELEKKLKIEKEQNDNLEIEKIRMQAQRDVEEDIEGANYEQVIERINIIRKKNKYEEVNKDQNYLIEKLHRDLEMKEAEIMQLKENFDSLYMQLIENQNMLKEEINLKNKVEQEKQAQILELNQIKKEISKYKENLQSFKQNLTDSQMKPLPTISMTDSQIKPVPPVPMKLFDNTDSSNTFNDKMKQLESTIADVQSKKKQINQDNQLLKQRLQSLDNQLSHRSQSSCSNLSQVQ